MRKSKQETAETRKRILATAAAEFREHGIVATGLAEVMKAAGLTHGGFYRHFDSKDQLVAEANDAASSSLMERLSAAVSKKSRSTGFKSIVSRYLSTRHRDHAREGCPLAALGSELARSDLKTRKASTEGFARFVEILSTQFSQYPPSEAKKKALVAAATMIGALTVSRVLTDEALSKTVLRCAQEHLIEFQGGESIQ